MVLHNIKWLTRTCFLFISVVCYYVICPYPAVAEDILLLKELESKVSNIQSLSCEFKQEKHLAMFNEVLVSTGRFYFQKPDRLRWEYIKPVRMGFVLNGRKGKRWSEIDGSETGFDPQKEPGMMMIRKQLLAWATFNLKWLQKTYYIQVKSKEPVILSLRPKNSKAQIIDHLYIRFTKNKNAIDTLELHEKDGDFTRIKFSNQKINVVLSKNIFNSQ